MSNDINKDNNNNINQNDEDDIDYLKNKDETVEIIEGDLDGVGIEGDDEFEEDLEEEGFKNNNIFYIKFFLNLVKKIFKLDNEIDMEMSDINDNSTMTISHHDGSVFCLDFYKNLLASGGEDDKACVWFINNDPNSLEKFSLIYETEKFNDSVTNVKFSHDGKYLAVSDMAGKARVYTITHSVDEKSIELSLFWSYDVENDIEQLKWHPKCNVLFISTQIGNLWMFKLSTNEIKIMYSGEETRLTCFTFLKDGKNLLLFPLLNKLIKTDLF
jgi:WD40 repeat protein